MLRAIGPQVCTVFGELDVSLPCVTRAVKSGKCRTAPQARLGVSPPFHRPARRRLGLLRNPDIEGYLVAIGPMVSLWPPSGDGLNTRLGEDQSFEEAGELIP